MTTTSIPTPFTPSAEMYNKIKALYPTQEELIAATYVRTGMLPLSSFEKGKKASDIEVGYAAFDIKTSVNPPLLLSFVHKEMEELAKLYEQNDKLLAVIDNVKKPVITTKPVKAKAGNGCAYSKPAAC